MAKKPASARKKIPRRQVSIDEDLQDKAKELARKLGCSTPDYINARLRPIIEKEFAEKIPSKVKGIISSPEVTREQLEEMREMVAQKIVELDKKKR